MSTPPSRTAADDLDLGETVRGLNSEIVLFYRFKTKRILGRGGMGVVWLATDLDTGRDVALKFMPEIVSMDATAVHDLRKETRNGMLLSHPNVVQMIDIVEEDTSAAIAMEYIDGPTLAQLRLQQPEHVFDAPALKPYLDQLLSALDYAHREVKLFHRDLKPANLMLTSKDVLKVADFGIASCVRDSVSRISLRSSGAGTMVYASPQQLDGEVAKAADDLYSLGATLYELLTGKPPFYTGDVLQQVKTRVPPRVNERRSEFGIEGPPVPAAWEEAIAACLEKDVADRPADIAALRDGLNGKPFKRTSGSMKSLSATARARRDRAAGPAFPAWALGLIAVVLLGGGAAFWYMGIYLPAQDLQARQNLAAAAEKKKAALALQAETKRKTEAAGQLAAYQAEVDDADKTELTPISVKEKLKLWSDLELTLREYDYPFGDDEVAMRARVAKKLAEWTSKDHEEQAGYQKLLTDLKDTLKGLQTDSAKPELGAAPKLKRWQAFNAQWKVSAFNAAYGQDHVKPLAEARQAEADWQAKAAAETPKQMLPSVDVLFDGSPIAFWDSDEKRAAVAMIQNVLKSAGQVTKFNRDPDGKYDQPMHEAIVAYQQNKELPATGKLEKLTLLAMQVPTDQRPKAVAAKSSGGGGSGRSGGGSSGGGGGGGGGTAAPEWTKWLGVAAAVHGAGGGGLPTPGRAPGIPGLPSFLPFGR